MARQATENPPHHPLDTLIVFPPYSKNTQDSFYPAPYVLAEYAISKGFDARVWDINHSITDILLDGAAFQNHVDGLSAMIQKLENQPKLTPREVHRHGSACLDDLRLRFAQADLLSLRGTTRLASDSTRRKSEAEKFLRPLLDACIPSSETRLIDFSSLDSLHASFDGAAAKRFRSILQPWVKTVIRDWKPRVLGISIAFMPQFIPAMIIAKLVRTLDPGIHICFGGPTLSLMPDAVIDQILKGGFCDSLVRKEGEVPFVELLARIRDSEPFADIPEIEAAGGRTPNPPRPAVRVLGWDERPKMRPEPSLLAINPYRPEQIPVIHSRGCYWNRCSFCDYPNLYSSQKFSARPVAHVLDDVEFYAKQGAKNVWLTAEALPPRDARRLAEGMLERNLGIEWRGFIRADHGFDQETLALLARSGFKGIVGLESTNDRILGLLCKGYNGSQAERFLDSALAAGILFQQVNIIVDVPTTTYAEALEVFQTAYRYRSITRRICDTPFELTMVSKMARNPERYGIEVLGQDHQADGLKFGTLRYRELFGGMTTEERQDITNRYLEANREITAGWSLSEPACPPKTHSYDQKFAFPAMNNLVSRALPFSPSGAKSEIRTLLVQPAYSDPVRISGAALEILEVVAGKELDRDGIENLLKARFQMGDPARTVDLFLELCFNNGLIQN